MTEQDRIEQLNRLVQEMNSLEVAMDSRDPSLAGHVYFDSELNALLIYTSKIYLYKTSRQVRPLQVTLLLQGNPKNSKKFCDEHTKNLRIIMIQFKSHK